MTGSRSGSRSAEKFEEFPAKVLFEVLCRGVPLAMVDGMEAPRDSLPEQLAYDFARPETPNRDTLDQDTVDRWSSSEILKPITRPSTRPPWMDAEEVAACLGTSAHTMRRLAQQGRSPVVVRRVGGRWRWSRADATRFVNGESDSAA